MKKFLVAICVLLSVFYLTLSTPEKRPEAIDYHHIKVATVPAALEKKKDINTNAVVSLNLMNAPHKAVQVEHPQAGFIKNLKKEKIIQAKVEDGYAIAYGDVLLGEVDRVSSDSSLSDVYVESTAIVLWDSNKIHYYIEPDLVNKTEVEKAIEIMNKTTVMEFVPIESPGMDGILFKAGNKNCYSYLGKIGGIQPIVLSQSCKVTEILHEILHALGFIHEQSRSDRDEYITVLWDNILPEYFSQFQIVPDNYMITVEGTDFDFSSIMLYRPDSFSKKEGMKTMQAKGNAMFSTTFDNLGKIDIERIDRVYGR